MKYDSDRNGHVDGYGQAQAQAQAHVPADDDEHDDTLPLMEMLEDGRLRREQQHAEDASISENRKRVPAGPSELPLHHGPHDTAAAAQLKRGQSTTSQQLYIWGLIAMYIILNSSLNLANRYALGMISFAFPISLTCMHMLFSFIVLSPYFFSGARRERSIAVLKRAWKVCVYVCVCA